MAFNLCASEFKMEGNDLSEKGEQKNSAVFLLIIMNG